ncbi:MAG TPA: translation initiation factor IF-2 subunit alpha [Methanocorpusculum sp.]|nr:translation initiation factor IF-2 subunit alpha [Methanocorpusculum sp.]HJJ40246.1 translation initiation factor IF-2 subunit alpha [Methanocorpusculum sp.]HJJ49635.1 translation initiation factor IF-2 subunit alpha [Methanocorpusculum sp.]HJJ57779.1 translation initiation factor IF-2 subunit alpha [Methanocorpusculum sp.]
MSERDWPQEGELVVCSVTEVKDFAAFVTLDEYEKREGLIPIAEVARGWIKYIRDYVREGQKIVCKVLNVDTSKGHIDLSLKDVNEHQRRDKIQDWKNEQKASKWIGFASKACKIPEKELSEAMYNAKYTSLYDAFEDIALDPEKTLAKFDLPAKGKTALQKMAEENVKIQKVTVSAILELTSNKPDGVNIIRRALRSAEPKVDGAEIELLYLGAPNYRIKVTATDYKKANSALKKAADAAIGVMERADGIGKLIQQK